MRTPLLVCFFTVTGCSGFVDEGIGDPPPPAVNVQVTVRDGAIPQPGVHVIFQDASDAVIADTMTDANGVANVAMEAGNVTVIRSFPLPTPPEEPRAAEVYTYVGVKAGDQLVLGDPTSDAALPAAINVLVPETSQGTVTVQTPCGSGQGAAPMVAVSLKGCTPSSYYVMDNDGSFFAHAAYAENVDLSLNSYVGSLSSSLSAVNVLPGATVSVERRLESEGFLLYSSNPQRVEATPANIDVPQLIGVEQVIVAAITDPAGSTQMVASHALFESGPAVVDAAGGLTTVITEAPKFEPTGITWLEAAATNAPDVVISTLTVTRGGPENPNNKYVRTTIAPYGAQSLRLPTLPASAILYNPTMDDNVNVAVGLAKISGGYDAIRSTVFTVATILDVSPMDGQITLSYLGTPP